MNNPLLLLPPIVNVVVTGLFAGVVLQQYLRRQRSYQLYWSIALGMAFIATLAYIFMLAMQPTSAGGRLLFRIYYVLGATVMPSWLGLGSIALVCSERITRICLLALCILSICGAGLIFAASINMPKLAQIAGTPGTGTLQPGAWLVATIVLNTLGVLAVVGVAIYSGWKLLRRQAKLAGIRTSNVLWANIFILVGALLNATAGTLARVLGTQDNFWLIMALGWTVLFLGVLLASHRSGQAKTAVVQQKAADPVRI